MKTINFLDYAEYNEIICRLIYEFDISSEIKVIFLAYSLKNNSYNLKPTNQKYGTLNLILDGIKLGFRKDLSDFTIIFDCLELLKNNAFIKTGNGKIEKLKQVPIISKEINCLNLSIVQKAINEVKKLSDESIIRSVIEYV